MSKVKKTISKKPIFCAHEWLELRPKGLIFEGTHFIFLLENEAEQVVLPLRYPLQAVELIGAVHMQSLWKRSLSFLRTEILKDEKIEFKRCVFARHTSGQHFVKLFYIRDGEIRFIEKDLEHVLGLAIEAELPFYATRAYIQETKVSTVDDQKNQSFLLNQQWTESRQKYLI